ncbi:MAG: ATP-binding protein [Fibrobacteres bacterium]|nr:ATP-binding protein [Fibrobacterota bacterium]
MFIRQISDYVLKISSQYPVITLTGPRQSGKTTLVKTIFPQKPYVSLENPDVRAHAEDDPRGFLKKYENGAIFDEIQRAPNIPSYLQSMVDENREPGRFVLTGSQQFSLSAQISQSLAGRTAMVRLLPLSLAELSSQNSTLDQLLFSGMYPAIHDKKLDVSDYYANYLETYVERDLRQLANVGDLHLFHKFLGCLAARVGSLLNMSNLSNDVGVSMPTIQRWISILEAGYIVFLLQPFHKNISKRLIKTPKVYFYDTGLLSYLLKISTHDALATHQMRGPVFENFVILEIMKNSLNIGKRPQLLFFRTQSGDEVDLIVEEEKGLTAVEIKSSLTWDKSFLKGLNVFSDLFGQEINRKVVVFAGEENFVIADSSVMSWDQIRFESK